MSDPTPIDRGRLPNPEEPPLSASPPRSWSAPELRELPLSDTRSGNPDDTKEGDFYETKS